MTPDAFFSRIVEPTLQYSRLTVIGPALRIGGRTAVLCRCECGKETAVQRKRLTSGHTKSCGCLQRQRGLENVKIGQRGTHGLSRTKEHQAWIGMKSRVKYETMKSSERYRGRGIAVFPEWERDFEAFLRHIGPAPSGAHSVDRIDNDGDYVPGNVRWATSVEQNRNKSDNVIVTVGGREMTLVEAVETAAVSYATAWHRIQRAGWSIERALNTPVGG